MGRGVVSGLIWGMVVSVVVLAALSLSVPLPERTPDPQASEAMPDAADGGLAETAPPLVPDAEETEQASAPAVVSTPDVGAGDALPEVPVALPATAPNLPQIDAAPQSGTAPLPIAEGAANDAVPAPQMPAPAPAASIAQTPSQPMPAALPAAPPPQFTATADASAGGAAPNRVMVQQREDRLDGIDTAPPPAPMPTPSLDPVTEPEADAEAAPDGADAPTAPTQRLPQVAPPMSVVTAPPAEAVLPQVRIEAAAPVAVVPDVADTPVPVVPEAPAGALAVNAEAFEALQDQPIMSVVLIDDPANAFDPAILAQISFPVSFALDPLQPEAAARAALLREAGFEVVILGASAIPAGATPADVEVALAAAQATLPQAVALIDNPAARIQGDRAVLEATVAALGESGHGLIAFPRGTNTAETTARREGVAAATVFRLLDDEDQRAPVITRVLDRAAFAAVQEGAVIVVGRTRPDTITAVFSWALGGRAEGVRLAPVSAALVRMNP